MHTPSPRRVAALVLLAALLVLSVPSQTFAAHHGKKKPNILFIFADDQAYDTIGAMGNDVIKTPHLDRLVNNGLAFTHCYNMGSWSGAVCVASRTMLNSGRYLWAANRIYGKAEDERKAGRWWSEHMKKAGYKTYFTGKWHVRASAEKSFDMARHVRPGMPNQTKEGYNRPHEGKPDKWSPYDPKFGGFWKGGKHWSEIVADDTLDYFKDAKNGKKPFFMYVAFNAPHDPRQSPKKYVDMYPLKSIPVPQPFLEEYPYNKPMDSPRGLRDERLAPFPRTEFAVKVNRQEYYAIISHMDEQIGRILDALDKSGMADNTWIFFSADHGLACGHHGLMGKQNMYDHSVRMPFFVVGPGVKKGQRIATPIYLQDIMPTTLELAGVKKPDHVDFHSLLPVIQGKAKKHAYDAIYGAYLSGQRAVTMDGYKLILYPKASVARLYHVAKDPLELKDIAKEAGSKPIMKKLFARLLALQKETSDSLDLTKTYAGLK